MTNDYTYPTDVHDDVLGYDANHNDPSQFCRHGTFIGSWWGPDYMCFWCEMGEEPPTPAEQLEIDRSIAVRQAESFDDLVERLLRHTIGYGYFGRMAQVLEDIAEENRYAMARRFYDPTYPVKVEVA